MSAQIWAKAFGTPEHEQAYSCIAKDSVLIVAGDRWSNGFFNGVVAGFSPSGQLSWAFELNNALEGYPTTLQLSSDSLPLVISSVPNNTVDKGYGLMIKLNSQADVMWARRYYTPLETRLTKSAAAPGGNILLPGSVQSDTGPIPMVWKVSSDQGRKRWCVFLSGIKGEASCAACPTENRYLVFGHGLVNGSGDVGFVAGLDSTGLLLWSKSLGSGFVPLDAAVVGSSVAFCGYYSFYYGQYKKMFVARMNSDGQLLWCVLSDDSTGTSAFGISVDQNGHLLVSGYSENITPDVRQAVLLVMDTGGQVIRGLAFTPDASGEFRDALQLGENRFVLGGTTTQGTGGVDILVLAVDSSGEFPGCTEDYRPGVRFFSPDTGSLTLSQPYIYSNYETISGDISPLSLRQTDACVDVQEHAGPVRCSALCFGIPGGLAMTGPGPVRVYSVDGRQVFQGWFPPGRHFVKLDPGVFFWQVDSQRGSAVVPPQ